MADKPILFSAPMVRALLSGTKNQTRRILKPQPIGTPWFWEGDEVDPKPMWFDGYEVGREPCGAATREVNDQIKVHTVDDRLWVKETWRPFSIDLSPWDIEVSYAADDARRTIKDGEFGDNDWSMPKAAGRGNVSPLFMPRWASRLTLIVTDVRVQRLQNISEEDAIAEGVVAGKTTFDYDIGPVEYDWFTVPGFDDPGTGISAVDMYSQLWDHINGSGAWNLNPWIVAYTFRVIKGNIDQIGGDE